MFTTPKDISKLLPVVILAASPDLENFLAHACLDCLGSPGFIDAEGVRALAARSEEMLESAGLPVELRHGAVAAHVEYGNGVSSQVRPAVHLQFRRDRKQWHLQQFRIGLVFPHEPIVTGIGMTWRQRAYILWTCSPALQPPWVKV